jgi:hypothetical protein
MAKDCNSEVEKKWASSSKALFGEFAKLNGKRTGTVST